MNEAAVPPSSPMNAEEQAAWDLTSQLWVACKNLTDYNFEELAAAIHVLQAVPIQHMLHRLWPDQFASWQKPPE